MWTSPNVDLCRWNPQQLSVPCRWTSFYKSTRCQKFLPGNWPAVRILNTAACQFLILIYTADFRRGEIYGRICMWHKSVTCGYRSRRWKRRQVPVNGGAPGSLLNASMIGREWVTGAPTYIARYAAYRMTSHGRLYVISGSPGNDLLHMSRTHHYLILTNHYYCTV